MSYENAFPNLSFNFPVEIQSSVDGSNRLFVIEQPGIIKVFSNSAAVPRSDVTNFIDLTDKVSYSAGQEIGLLGMAFHPNYATNGYVFVYYIDKPTNYRINIVRYKVNETDKNSLDPSSSTIIAQFTKNVSESNHNGGKIAFGPDGYLYISIGDGGGGFDPQGNGQNLNTVFGSILRIDIDVDGNNPLENNSELPNGNYEIPSDNPRVGLTGLDEIYAWGIRNTWKFTFDANGNLWGADVGQNNYEEINLIIKGGNYGWNKFEANSETSYGSGTSLVTTPDIKPIFYYDRSNGDVSITGGYVYRGSLSDPILKDNYIYADYASGRVWALEYNESDKITDNNLVFRTNGETISSFGEDESGELYFSEYDSSAKIYKLTESSSEPVITPVNGVGVWKTISTGVNGIVETMVESTDGNTYIGGSFTTVGDIPASNLAIIDADGNWQSFGTGSNGTIYSLAIAPNGTIFAAGDFNQIDGVFANNIAYWNGSNWSPLGTGTNGPIAKIAFDSTGTLFVGGVFTTTNGIMVNNITQWKDNVWSSLIDSSTGIIGTNNEVRAIAFDENNILYIGGNFDTAGGNSAVRIAKWDGSNWSNLGPGTSGFVQAIETDGNYIYAGGNFTVSGSQTVNRIARYNRSTQLWENLGNGLSGNVNTIVSSEGYIYVGGSFVTASDNGTIDKIVNNIARWSIEEGWQALGPNTNVGVSTRVNSLEFTKNNTELIVGGNFNSASKISTNNIAIWKEYVCEENSIIPEYQINGENKSGSNSITINEGDDLILKMLPTTTDYSITLPDGTKINGDHNLGNVTKEQSGIYKYSTINGCNENFEIIIEATIEQDDDNDGVLNENDSCPNTPNGEAVNTSGCSLSQIDSDNDGINDNIDTCSNTPKDESVNENGCSIFTYPNDQFKITSTGTSCIDSNNGVILIESKTSGSFVANLKGPATEMTIPFTSSLEIPDLSKGEFQLCLTSTDFSNYQNCAKVVITEPESLTVQLDVNSITKSITLKMSGSKGYTVEINGKTTHTESNEINLPLYDEINNIKVVSDQLCQEKFEETIVLDNTFLVYPNPIEDYVTVDLRSLTSTSVEIAIFTESGVLLTSKNYEVKQLTVTLDTSSLSSGIYFLRLKNEIINKSYKLVKP